MMYFFFFNRLLYLYDETLLFKNPILTNIFSTSSKIFAIIPLIISKIKYKRINNQEINDQQRKKNQYFKYIYVNKEKKIIKGKWIFIILSAILFLFNQFLYVYSIKIKANTSILNLLITSFFYYLILKNKLFKHHYISGILILLLGLSSDLILKNLQNDIN